MDTNPVPVLRVIKVSSSVISRATANVFDQRSTKVSPKGRDYAMIEYKGYIGVVDFDPDIDLFHGTVINTQDVITFYGASVTELRAEMQKSLEVYFEVCKEQGKTPDKPFSGTLMLETSPELYSRIALNAARRQLEIDAYLQEILEKAVLTD